MFKPTILVVEDDDILLNILCDTLEEFGCDVARASNGAEAVEILKDTPFDVIISDIKMPEMDGLSLLETLRDMEIYTPVVMMTGYSEYKEGRINHAGGVVLLEKPFTREKLKELFDEYITLLPTG
jgi:CheY-like chemotaxis protein